MESWRSERTYRRPGETGDLIALMKLHEEFLRDLMADFYFIQHGDLLAMLRDLAAREGVLFRYNSNVVHVDSKTGSVILDGGQRIVSDLIIGADGLDSFVRTGVAGKRIVETRTKRVTLNFTIPISLMLQDEILKSLTGPSDWAIWLGDGYLLHGSTVNAGQDFSMVLQYTPSEDFPEFNEQWQDTYPLEHFNLDLEKFEPRVRKLLHLARNFNTHLLVSRPHLDHFVCDRARLVLVGEAAHPMLHGGQHTTALCIEDAETLGNLFSGVQSQDQIPQLLAAYEELRQARCITTEEIEKRLRSTLMLPAGEARQQRDMKLRNAMACQEWDHMDEKTFKETYSDELKLFLYDATEKVEDWWTKWGPLILRGTPNRRSSMQLSIMKEM
ncbi:hypothetical protein H0H93_010014 [Arthromyces matolae]|nr:hypothetical protein H0H93_010014 [Arthromyces matolae]